VAAHRQADELLRSGGVCHDSAAAPLSKADETAVCRFGQWSIDLIAKI
jgi:hypothetical protein